MENEAQNIRISLVVGQNDIEETTALFAQSGWTLNEVELLPMEDDPGAYTWILDVNQLQKETIAYMTPGEVSIINDGGAQEDDNGVRNLIVTVNREQEELLRQFMQEQDWNVNELIRGEAQEVANGDQDGDGPARNHPLFVLVAAREDEETCPECFCKPCVTHPSNEQGWWPSEDSQANIGNNRHRRKLYHSFWTMMYNRGAWTLPQYLEKKNQQVGRVNIKREVMPACICDQVRRWFPNPPDIPYMGHRN